MCKWLIPAAGLGFYIGLAFQLAQAEDPRRGEEVYRGKCLPCHSLEPGQNIIGPTLANVWGRRAGKIALFPRYSEVMKNTDVVWDQTTLDRLVRDGQGFMPGNLMPFQGIQDDRERTDLLGYLKVIGSAGPSSPFRPPEDQGYLSNPLEIMDRNTYEVYTFDPHQGKPAKISYTVSKAGRVRIRVVRKVDKSLVLRTLQDWKQSRFGIVYSLEWDGKDASGNVLDNKGVFVLFESKDPLDRGRARVHADHAENGCRDPEVRIVSPPSGATIRGQVSVVVALAESAAEKPVGSGDNYQGRLYVDYSLAVRTVMQKSSRYTFALDTTKLTDGPHLLTVNTDDGNDHVGTASIFVTVEH